MDQLQELQRITSSHQQKRKSSRPKSASGLTSRRSLNDGSRLSEAGGSLALSPTTAALDLVVSPQARRIASKESNQDNRNSHNAEDSDSDSSSLFGNRISPSVRDRDSADPILDSRSASRHQRNPFLVGQYLNDSTKQEYMSSHRGSSESYDFKESAGYSNFPLDCRTNILGNPSPKRSHSNAVSEYVNSNSNNRSSREHNFSLDSSMNPQSYPSPSRRNQDLDIPSQQHTSANYNRKNINPSINLSLETTPPADHTADTLNYSSAKSM
jgi:hypothetical protein